MELTFSYFVKSAIVLLALYLFYYGLLRNQNSFTFNRVYLLLAPLVALALPLLKWPAALAPESAIGEALQAIQLSEITVTGYSTGKKAAGEAEQLSPVLLTGIAYTIGALLVLLKLIKQLWQLKAVKTIAMPAAVSPEGIKVYQLPDHLPTFAFGNKVFLGKQEHLSKTDQEQVLAHELAHVELRHTWDVLYYEVLSAILWANPIIWLLKQELRDVHEYQADAKVITAYQQQSYSSLLSKEALLSMGLPLGSYFQKPQVLKRLHMLRLSGRKSGWIRQAMVAPLIVALAMLFSVQQVEAQTSILDELAKGTVPNETEDAETAEIQKNTILTPAPAIENAPAVDDRLSTQPVAQPAKKETEKAAAALSEKKTEAPAPVIVTEEKPFVYVEEMPRFIGGETEMLKYLAKNIRYPKEAQAAGASGLVVVSFTVEKDGSLQDVQIVRSVEETIDAEALRVVESMSGNWQPGKQNGTPVRVRYTLPVRFTLKQ